ncbi:MAG TPA: NAD(P)-dependent oxidoreductase [Terriglobales bacterium]|nr:NAD(P)-dependent oxidoreductase [Terriglobales bacterium]
MSQGSLILVTGGEGFIGRHVRSALLAGGQDVISLDSRSMSQSAGELSHQCDLTDAQGLQQIFASAPRRISAIAHLASTLRTASEKDPKKATQINILGSLNVLEAARIFGVERIVFASSVSIYGSKGAQDDVSERDFTAPEDMYGAAKKYIEVLGNAYSRKYGMRFVTLRIPIVVGSGPGTSTSAWRTQLFNALQERRQQEVKIPFADHETLSIVHAEDLANAFSILLNSPIIAHNTYNAPCEIWQLSGLKKEVESLSEKIRVSFGDAAVTGFPRRLNCDRFRAEFHHAPSLLDRLRHAAQVHGADL